MTYTDLRRLSLNALDCTDYDKYIADVGGSVDDIKMLPNIWEYAHDMTFTTVRKQSELSQAAFSRIYNIPLRTIENWLSGVNTPPNYLLDLLELTILHEAS